MTKIETRSTEQLHARRQQILDDLKLSADEFRRRAAAYSLVGREHDAWDELRDIEFLLEGD